MAAFILAGCGQAEAEAEVQGAAQLANDCKLAADVVAAANTWIESDRTKVNFYDRLAAVQSISATSWPQIDDNDVKEIIKTLAQPAEITRGGGFRGVSAEAKQRIYLSAYSLRGWQAPNCRD